MNKVGSALMAFFSVAVQESKLVAWSDSCSGQNKNFGIICLWHISCRIITSKQSNTNTQNQAIPTWTATETLEKW